MFPLMGLLFTLFCLGALTCLAALVPRLRRIALPCAAALMIGSTSSCVLAWGLAIGGEAAFSTNVGNVAFWVGFAGGLFVGGFVGATTSLRRLRRAS